jgi:hypothetical protein
MYFCIRGFHFASVSAIFQLYFEAVRTVRLFLLLILLFTTKGKIYDDIKE